MKKTIIAGALGLAASVTLLAPAMALAAPCEQDPSCNPAIGTQMQLQQMHFQMQLQQALAHAQRNQQMQLAQVQIQEQARQVQLQAQQMQWMQLAEVQFAQMHGGN